MPAHGDILDRPQPMVVPFWTSVVMHVVVLGGLSVGYLLENRFHLNMGSPTGGGPGAVMVNPVATIPIPNRGGPNNPVATDTESQVPTPPAPKEKAKPAPQVKTPPPNAIALKSDKAPKQREAASPPNKFRDQQKYNESQVYSQVGTRANSPMYGVQGGGGVRLGDSSPFGEQFGSYATLVRDVIARNWKTAELNLRAATAPAVVVLFTIRRDGSVTNVKIGQTSGIASLDNSAQRAVYDAQLPTLPPQFPRNQADVELRFELGK